MSTVPRGFPREREQEEDEERTREEEEEEEEENDDDEEWRVAARASGVAAVLAQKRRRCRPSFLIVYVSTTHFVPRREAWAASLASPGGVPRAHLR